MARICLTLVAFALLPACKERETRLRVTFPSDADGGTCEEQTNVRCVNYLQFTAGAGGDFFSHCMKVDVTLDTFCDVAKLADGAELFTLPPDTPLPITLQGMRVYPATSCSSPTCAPRIIFSGTTVETGRIADYAGRELEIPLNVVQPCGTPEVFFFPPPGASCAQVCEGEIVCEVQGGCLCKSPMQ